MAKWSVKIEESWTRVWN